MGTWSIRNLIQSLAAMGSSTNAKPRTYTLNFVGDVMLGRLIDGLYTTNAAGDGETVTSHCQSLKSRFPHLHDPNPATPWGTALSLFQAADLNFINLETPLTTSNDKWPDKVFNYRRHPERVKCLSEARIDYAGLANNHVLDFGVKGMEETTGVLTKAGIAYAGVATTAEDAIKPAVMRLPRNAADGAGYTIHIWAASDHPRDWRHNEAFHLIDYSASTRARLKKLLTKEVDSGRKPDLKIFSVHWGPNYACHPSSEIRSLAHFLVDECGIDIIHGHSSHHVQGVEVYHGSLIIYGCGDFIDDYAVNDEFRNDLGAAWTVTIDEVIEGKGLKVKELKVVPTRIEGFRAMLSDERSGTHWWVCGKVRELSTHLGIKVEAAKGSRGELVVEVI